MQRFGKYEVVGKIGEGGFGSVYEGFDPRIRRRVAIKTCASEDAAARRRFLREAEISGNLHHRNITILYDLGDEGGVPYMVQELLTGEDLAAKIARRQPLSFAVKLLYLVQIARGLEYAHSQGIVHRDVTPANIRVLDDGLVKVMDFGIADHEGAEASQPGQTIGTAGYLSPERIRSEEVDQRTDIYGFGVLAYELLTLQRAFPGDDVAAVLRSILGQSPPPIRSLWPECPVSLAEIVMRCLAKRPVDRYASFTEVARALEGLKDRPSTVRESTAETIIPTSSRPAVGGPPAADPMLAFGLPSSPTPAAKIADTAARIADAARIGGHARSARASRAPWLVLIGAGALVAGVWLLASLGVPLPFLGAGAGETATDSPATAVAALPDPQPAPPASAETAPIAAQSGPTGPATVPQATPAAPKDATVPAYATLVIERGWNPAIQVSVSNRPAETLEVDRSYRLQPGADHLLEFTLFAAGYQATIQDQVRLRPGEQRRIRPPIPRPAGLVVRVVLRAPQVFVRVDGRSLGFTPVEPLLLAPGRHRVEVFRDASETSAIHSAEVELHTELTAVVTFDPDRPEEPAIVAERPLPRS